jgi:protein-tyrosine kinase
MGKIFDALEKADSNVAHTIPLTRPASEPKDSARGEGDVKIVTLGNQGKISSSKLDPNLIAYHAPQSIEAEIFKGLRTNLLFPATGKPHKKILVTGAMPGDGKSFVASNLAISIALGIEEYVLLIDCDMRRPTIHSRFGFGLVAGLSEHLASGEELSHFLLKSPVPKLTILPAGHPPANPTELLTSRKMKHLLEKVSQRYDDRYIIIDSPPPSMAAETKAMVSYVDGIIVVVKAGKTPKKMVTETIEQIGKEKLIGVVLNYSENTAKNYYGYGNSYYASKKE